MTKGRKRRHESGTPPKEDGAGAGLQESIEELKAFIEAKTGKAVEEIRKTFEEKLTGIEESLNFAYATIMETSQKLNQLEDKMKNLSFERDDIQRRLSRLEYESEEADRLRRRPMLIFSGADLHIPENDMALKPAIAALINRFLEVEVDQGQITHVQRTTRNRLLVKFSRDDRGSLRDQVYRAKARLRGHELYINESLTPTRQEALSFLLEMRRQRKISAALTRGGDVFYATSRTDRLIRIRSKEEAEYRLRQEHGHQDDRPEPPAPVTSAAASAPTVERRAEGRGRGRAPAPVSCAGGGPGGRDQLPGSVEAPPTAVPAAAPARTAEGHIPDTLVTGREGRADCFVLHAAGGVALDRAGPDRTSPEHLGAPAGPGPAGRALASERAEAVPVPEGPGGPDVYGGLDNGQAMQDEGEISEIRTSRESGSGCRERHLRATAEPRSAGRPTEMALVAVPAGAADRRETPMLQMEGVAAAESGRRAEGMRDIRTYWR